MNRKFFFYTAFILLSNNFLIAQTSNFISSGVIEFEKKANMYVLIKRKIGNDKSQIAIQALDQFITTQSRFKILKSKLTFDDNKTLFTPIDNEITLNGWYNIPFVEQHGIVYSDLKRNTCISQKNYFGETFLIKDSIRQIKWKITDETREIAGYLCRRANAIILDSVYIVAFYSSQIKVSGGPESFSGLPGMILGIALPHENITWFATKISTNSTTEIEPPNKGKPITNYELFKILDGINSREIEKSILRKIILF